MKFETIRNVLGNELVLSFTVNEYEFCNWLRESGLAPANCSGIEILHLLTRFAMWELQRSSPSPEKVQRVEVEVLDPLPNPRLPQAQ
jgi:hypothetical protein